MGDVGDEGGKIKNRTSERIGGRRGDRRDMGGLFKRRAAGFHPPALFGAVFNSTMALVFSLPAFNRQTCRRGLSNSARDLRLLTW